ncbi:MAG: class I SAM-dependent methyltransferase [Bacteroidota bacterium]
MINRELNYGRHHIRKFLEMSAPYQIVLDLGAGHGDDLQLAQKFDNNVKLHALESYPPYVEELQNKGISVFSANIERDTLPFDDESVDVIIMNQIMEHVKEVFWILHEVTRVLKVGGNFIVGVPNLAALHNRLLLLLGKQPSPLKNHSAHVRGYTKGDFHNLLNSGFPRGYLLKNFGGSNFYPFPPVVARPLAIVLPTMAWGIFMRWQKVNSYKYGFLDYPVKSKLETNFYLG